jgi:phosphatidylglycerophosphatase A
MRQAGKFRWPDADSTIFPERMIKTSTSPGFGFLAHPAHMLACGFGSGLAPVASGTFGTLAAWPLYLLIKPSMTDGVFAIFLLLAFAIGSLACHRTGRDLGVPDHGAIVWDEIVAFWLVLWVTPPEWMWQLAAFFAFRLFDVFKPPPARWVDINMKNGFGVMLDDLIAAIFAMVSLALGKLLLEYVS